MNVLLLGLLAPLVMVAFYAGAEKIARAAVQGTGPITQVFFPRISHLMVHDRPGAARAARTSVWLMLGVGLSAGSLLFFGAPLLVKLLLGAGFEGAVPVLRILALLPPLIALSTAFGFAVDARAGDGAGAEPHHPRGRRRERGAVAGAGSVAPAHRRGAGDRGR